MQITIDGTEFTIEQQNAARVLQGAMDVIRANVRAKSLQAKAGIQLRMPVDTGRAKASWGNVPASPPAFSDDGIWDERDDGATIIQGSKVEYIEYLNEGSSSQAPAGFIDVEASQAQARLETELTDDLVRLFERGVLL